MTFQAIDKLIESGADDETAAARLLRSEKAIVAAIVRDYVANRRRLLTLEAERSAFAEFGDGTVEAFNQISREVVRLGDATEVAWGRLTRSQHLQRIAMLSKIRDGIDSTIQRHEKAVALLDEFGVECLDDVPEERAS